MLHCFLHLTKLSLPTTKFQMHSKVLVPSHEFDVLLLALGCRYTLSMTSPESDELLLALEWRYMPVLLNAWLAASCNTDFLRLQVHACANWFDWWLVLWVSVPCKHILFIWEFGMFEAYAKGAGCCGYLSLKRKSVKKFDCCLENETSSPSDTLQSVEHHSHWNVECHWWW